MLEQLHGELAENAPLPRRTQVTRAAEDTHGHARLVKDAPNCED